MEMLRKCIDILLVNIGSEETFIIKMILKFLITTNCTVRRSTFERFEGGAAVTVKTSTNLSWGTFEGCK